MTAQELILELQKLPPDTVITLNVGDPKDSAYTGDFSVQSDGTLDGWVASDDEDARAPWARDIGD